MLRIVALSGHQQQELLANGEDDLFDHWLTKPVKSTEVQREITLLRGTAHSPDLKEPVA